MNKLLIILSLCFVFATELEIDGDLKVTGNIEAGTIDSLQQVIADLQAQIAALQSSGNMTTKIITIEDIALTSAADGYSAYEINLDEIFNADIEYAIIHLIDYNLESSFPPGTSNLTLTLSSFSGNTGLSVSNNGIWSFGGGSPTLIYSKNYNDWTNFYGNNNLMFQACCDFSFDATLAVTADFSNAPTYQAPEPPQNLRTAQ